LVARPGAFVPAWAAGGDFGSPAWMEGGIALASAQTMAPSVRTAVADLPTKSVDSGPAARAATAADVVEDIFGGDDTREKFIPVTRQALLERLTEPQAWPQGQAGPARRFYRYLDAWRRQSYTARLVALDQVYEAFSPDSDLLTTRRFSETERARQQHRLVQETGQLLRQANYTRVDPAHIQLILTPDSHYGLNLEVDLAAFDELAIYYRGATKRTESKRTLRRFYLKQEQFDIPIFQRLFILFKLKPEATRIAEIMTERGCDREAAEKHYRRARTLLPPQIRTDFVYMKLFKNMPRSDLEMVFPNTRVRFRLFDKLKLGVTTGGSVGMGLFGAVGKIAVATNPVALAGAMVGLGGIALRQAMNFINQKNRYMVTMSQNLYFHAMADNRGVLSMLADRAAEEDVKEEMLLYTVLAKEVVRRFELDQVDAAIESYMQATFGVEVNFDIQDALDRLIADGLVTQHPDGTLQTLSPEAAAGHIDVLWDRYLDMLPDALEAEGAEVDVAVPDEIPGQPSGT
jgi:Protein of unknown function (DUF3754)